MLLQVSVTRPLTVGKGRKNILERLFCSLAERPTVSKISFPGPHLGLIQAGVATVALLCGPGLSQPSSYASGGKAGDPCAKRELACELLFSALAGNSSG